MNLSILIIYIFFMICFFVPSTAYAYLDPGTGNALIYVFLSLLGAGIYFIKGFLYRITKSKSEEADNNKAGYSKKDIVIFSEGKMHWNTFKPIVEKLLEKKQNFCYYTMDIEDPCLMIANRLMDNRYIGDGTGAYAKIGNLSANLVLSTTPNIGTKGYPIPRSKKIKKLIYVSHGFDDMAFLHRGSLDHYDTVLLMGDIEEPNIRKLEELRNLPKKELVPAGLPYMDDLIKKADSFTNLSIEEEKEITYFDGNNASVMVLLAPSWGDKGFLKSVGVTFIKELAKKGFNIIIRPHPYSLKIEKKLVNNIQDRLKHFDNIKWDFNLDGSQSFSEANILISDYSAVRLDFAFVYQKPVITIPIPFSEETLQDFEIADLGTSWIEEHIDEIGYTLKDGEIDKLDSIIIKVMNEKTRKDILEFRNKHVYNIGNSGEVIADYLIESKSLITPKT